MPLENVCAVEALLSGRAWTRTETAYHSPFIMGQCMSILVVFPCEALLVILASRDRALLWPLRLMGKHVCLEVLEDSTAFGNRAKTLFFAFLFDAITPVRAMRAARVN